MGKMKAKDIFANKAYGSVTMSAANTLTFGQIHFGTSIREKVALILHKIKYWLGATELNKLVAADDTITVAITRSSGLTTLGYNQASVLDHQTIGLELYGTPANAKRTPLVLESNLSDLPNGGIIAPADPIYLAMTSASIATAAAVQAWIYFTWFPMKPAEYWELVETMRVIE